MGRVFATQPSFWEADHAAVMLTGERYAESHEGSLPRNPLWSDLEFRYDRNPNAFAIGHPNFKLFFDGLPRNHEVNHVYEPIRPTHWIGRMRGPGWKHETERTPCVMTPTLNAPSAPEPESMTTAMIAVGSWLIAAYLLGRRESR